MLLGRTDYDETIVKKWSFHKFKEVYGNSASFKNILPEEREKALVQTFKALGGKLKEE